MAEKVEWICCKPPTGHPGHIPWTAVSIGQGLVVASNRSCLGSVLSKQESVEGCGVTLERTGRAGRPALKDKNWVSFGVQGAGTPGQSLLGLCFGMMTPNHSCILHQSSQDERSLSFSLTLALWPERRDQPLCPDGGRVCVECSRENGGPEAEEWETEAGQPPAAETHPNQFFCYHLGILAALNGPGT